MFAALTARCRGRPRRRALARGLVGLLVVAALLVAAGVVLAGRRPAWWPPDAPDAALAEPFENAVVRQLTAPREPDASFTPAAAGAWRSGPWAVSISEDDVNAWLATRLEAWLANREPGFAWPAGVSWPAVRFEEGVVRVGVAVTDDGRERVLSVAVVPRVDEHGALWLDDGSARLGRLPIPVSAARRLGPVAAGGAIEQVLAAFAGSCPLTPRAAVPLEGGRSVRVLTLTPRDGRLEVTCRTEGGG